MASFDQFKDEVRWTATEKKVARRAFGKALDRHLSAISTEAKRVKLCAVINAVVVFHSIHRSFTISLRVLSATRGSPANSH